MVPLCFGHIGRLAFYLSVEMKNSIHEAGGGSGRWRSQRDGISKYTPVCVDPAIYDFCHLSGVSLSLGCIQWPVKQIVVIL